MTEDYPRFEYPDHEQMAREVEAALNMRPEHRTDIEPPLRFETMEEGIARIRAQNEAMRPQRETEERKRVEERAHRVRAEKIARWKNAYKVVLATVALASSMKAGGFIDMAEDPFSDAGKVVAGAVPFEEGYIEHNAARQTVIDMYREIDANGYDKVVSEAENWKADHAEQFPTAETLQQFEVSVDESSTNEETIAALGDVMSFYNIGVDPVSSDLEGKESEVKELAKAYAKVFSELPKDFVAQAKLYDIGITNDLGEEIGVYESDGKIKVAIDVLGANVPTKAKNSVALPDYENVVAHELDHALLEGGLERIEMTVDALGGEWEEGGSPKDIWRWLAQKPEAPSLYSHRNSDEFNAELGVGLLSDWSRGLVDIQETRLFSSKRNKAELQKLVSYEAAYPGIAQLLVANRSH